METDLRTDKLAKAIYDVGITLAELMANRDEGLRFRPGAAVGDLRAKRDECAAEREAEAARLRGRVAELERWKAEAMVVMNEAHSALAETNARLGDTAGQHIRRLAARVKALRKKATDLEVAGVVLDEIYDIVPSYHEDNGLDDNIALLVDERDRLAARDAVHVARWEELKAVQPDLPNTHTMIERTHPLPEEETDAE